MEELKLNGYEMSTMGVEAAVLKMLGIDTTGMRVGAAPAIYAELDKQLAGKTICVEMNDILLYGHRIIELVTFCYERKCGLKLDEADLIESFLEYLQQRLVSDHDMPPQIAELTIKRMYPDGVFIHNRPRY